mmetsp:Transcript_31481/g.60716  ORF Transcript_31481/g.60716 Transcript_31481/m.60716 type:complete len:164 (-) Transcript_31481:92-583(-)
MIFKTEGATLEVVTTPGHSTDHVSLMLKEEKAIFSGDCVLGTGTTVVSNLGAYMKSLRKLLGLNAKVLYPGHGPVVDNPKETITYYISHRNKREAQILQVLGKATMALSSLDIVKAVYTDTPEKLHAAANRNVIQHLLKLKAEGKVTGEEGNTKWMLVESAKL